MCGFVGVVGSEDSLPNRALLRSMRDTLKHRGPDDAGDYYDEHIALGFRRLAILDLTPKGHQPMSNAAGNLWIVFNGEIYNHIELRDKLAARGYRFRSGSDTEVVLVLYECYGLDMLRHLNGMFAFAIYDKDRRKIILARDRMGVKPLFYWPYDRGLAFASELRALKQLPGFPRETDATAVAMYMRLNFVPGATCVYPGVQKLPPAHFASIPIDHPRDITITRYWNVDWSIETEARDETYWLDKIDELLNDAVRIRLRADVPLGSFLSGGIDSGLITAVASRIAGNDLRAFTVSFIGSDSDERLNAEATARHLKIFSHVEEIEGDSLAMLPELAAHFDEPFADMSIIPTFQICKKMKDYATVILSGDGGDELFGGYVYHPKAWRMRYLDTIPDSLARPALKIIAGISPAGSWLRRNSLRLSLPSRIRAAFFQRDICEEWQREVLHSHCNISTSKMISELQRYHRLGEGKTALDRAQAGDLELLLPDNMLVKVDRMSMKASVEVRSPFLDYRFAEMIPRIPPALRVKNGQTKYLLRRLAERYLPRQVVHGPKMGFDVSPVHWLSGNRRLQIQQWLAAESVNNSVVKKGGVDWLWRNVDKHPAYAVAVLRLVSWTLWKKQNLLDE